MPDLFNAPMLPGLALRSDFVTAAEEQVLIAATDAAELSPFRFQGWTGKRLTVSFGWRYDFDAGRLRRGDPLPGWLLPFRDRAAHFSGLPRDALVQALLIRYDPAAGIGWHKDRPTFEHVVGFSLGAPSILRFRRRRGETFELVQQTEIGGTDRLVGVGRCRTSSSRRNAACCFGAGLKLR